MLLKGKRSSNSNVVTLQQCCYFTAMLLPNSNVVKREGESKQQCFYLTAMLLKGKRSSNSNVVTLQQ
jgi:hypothetical protein